MYKYELDINLETFFQMKNLMGKWCKICAQMCHSDTEFPKPFGVCSWSNALELSFCSQTAAWVTDTDETLGLVSVSADFRVSVSDSVSI